MSDKDEIQSQILRDGQLHIVLPNAVVLEIVKNNSLLPAQGAPDWVLGLLSWHGQSIPLVSIGKMMGQDNTPQGHKCVIVKTLGTCGGLECYAIHTDAFPQFVPIQRQGMLVDASNSASGWVASMSILIGEKSVLIPDLDALEQRLGHWWEQGGR